MTEGGTRMKRWIMHVDMDAFFASVEQRDHEEYRGKPVIVGGLSSRGVAATASYEARRFGVHSAMPMAAAKKRCPQGIFVQGNHAHYREVSAQIFAIFARFSPLVEALSIDEAFLDITGMGQLAASPRAYAQRIKQAIYEETGLVASVGIAPNKFLAKLASDLQKPDGLVIIPPDRVREILWPLPIRRLWGVGKKTAEKLQNMGYETVGQIAQAEQSGLQKAFGPKLAAQLAALANGQDDRKVEPMREAKSIGKEITFPEDLRSLEQAEHELLELAEKVGWRLRIAGVQARTVQLKVRLGDFTTYTRSRTLSEATCYDEVLYATAKDLLRELKITSGFRLLGVTGTGFELFGQASLFTDPKKERLYHAIDAIKKRYGEGVLTKAQLVNKHK